MARIPKPWFNKERRAWFVTINGVRHRLAKLKKEAMDEFYRLMRQPADGPKVSTHSLPAIVDAFLDWVKVHHSPDTFEWYRYRLQRFIDNVSHDLPVEALKPYHVTRWVDSYPEFAKTSRRNYLRSVKRCLTWATKQGYIERNPVENLEVPAGERREIVIAIEEYERILSLIPDEGLQELVETTWETGCRPQESLRVEARHVDLNNQRWVFPPSEAKGEKWPRIVYLTDEALLITRRLLVKHPDGTLFRNSFGRTWTTDAVNSAFDRIQMRMGKETMKSDGKTVADQDIEAFIPTLKRTRICKGVERVKSPAELRFESKTKLTRRLSMSLAPRYSLYAIRHSWATHALERGLDSITVAVLLGHADASMLARVYQHLSQNPKYLLEQAKRARA